MELRQLADKAAAVENENERFHRSLIEASQKLAKSTEASGLINEQWEVQLGNLTKWVEDERQARSYLETVATDLTHQVTLFKEQQSQLTSSIPNDKSDWQTLRQKKKKDQQLLELLEYIARGAPTTRTNEQGTC